MGRNEAISLYQPLLHSIALKMVGTIEDAEDIVQDTFLRWLSIENKNIRNTKAYLIKSVSNNCLQFLNSLKQKVAQKTYSHDEYSHLEDHQQVKSVLKFDVEIQLTEAWAILHKKLEPLEKSIYILREVFNFEYDELQEIFDKKKDHCRQLFSRAKSKIESDLSKINLDLPKPLIPESFLSACNFGQLSDMITEFKNEVFEKIISKKT